MKTLLTAGLLAALLASATVGGTALAANRTAGARLLTLHRGDQLSVSGTGLHCSVSRQTPITLACGKGTAQGPAAGTYGFALADGAALVLRVGGSGQSGVVLRRRQPAPAGPATPAAPASARTGAVGDGTVLLVAGTHIVCIVAAQSGGNAITCGLSGRTPGTFQPGTFFAILTDDTVLLGHKLSGGAETALRRAQP